jgi:hypothetical protein
MIAASQERRALAKRARRRAEIAAGEAMSESEDFTGTMPVRAQHRFDEARLAAWMTQHVDGFRGPIAVEQFRGGQSNPTFRLAAGGRQYVLRRKPPGKLLPSAHAVDREYRVITALREAGIPVASVREIEPTLEDVFISLIGSSPTLART